MLDVRDDEDERLLSAGAHAELLAAYYPLVLARVRLRLPEGEAFEVTHRVFDRLIGELTRGRRYSAPFRVVVHNVIRWTLADYFRLKRDLPVAEVPEVEAADPFAEAEERHWLESLFARLPDRAREVLTLRWIEGHGPAEIAERLGIERNAVDQAIHRGYRTLREHWHG